MVPSVWLIVGPSQVLGKKFGGVRCAGATGVWDVRCMASVMVHGWANVPSIKAMWCPCRALIGFFVDNDFGAERCQGCSVEIKESVKMGLRGDFGVESRVPE